MSSKKLYNKDLAPTPSNKKNWGWFEIFNVWANDVQSLFGYTLAASLFIASGLNGWAVFLALILAGFFIMWLVNLSGKPSVKHGIPYPVFARVSMGVFGANFPAMARGLVAMFWYGAQTYAASTAVALLITALTGNPGTEMFLGMTGVMWVAFIFVSAETNINATHITPVIPKNISVPGFPVNAVINNATAVEAAYVCAPYQNIATRPLARGLVAMFWYGAQTYAASTAVALLITALTGNPGTEMFLGMTGVMWVAFIFVSAETNINATHITPVIPKNISVPGFPVNAVINNATAVEAAYVCAPYQNIATRPLAIAGKLAPNTPILTRAKTGYGIPCFTLGLPERLTSHIIKNPAKIKARNTAQPFNPEAINKDAAKV